MALDAASGIVPGPRNLYQSANAPTDLHFEVGGLQNETSYTFGEGPTLTNVAAWRIYRSHHDFDFDLRSVDILDTADARFNFSQVTEELRLTSPAHSPIDYQFGAFYYKGKSDRQDLTIGALGLGLPPPPAIAYLGVNSANNLDSKSYAGYGQGTFHLTDQLRLTVGGRYTHDDVSLYATQNDAPFVFSIAVPPVATFTPSQSANNFSWRISPQYDLGATTVAYVTVARGYKGPGYNLGWSGALPVGRETSLDYEAGIKSDIAANVQLNASVFWETFNNFQVQSFYQPSASYIVQNAGKSRSRGAEAQLAWRPLQSLKLTSAISYTEAVFTSFYGAPCYPGETAAQGCVGGQTNATGNSLSNAPRFTATVAADYTRDLTANLTGFLHADGYSRSTTNFSVNADPNTRQQGYQIGNASIALGSADEHWKASLYCRNCFDKRFVTYIESSAVGAPGDYNQSFAIDSFRVIGAAVDFKF